MALYNVPSYFCKHTFFAFPPHHTTKDDIAQAMAATTSLLSLSPPQSGSSTSPTPCRATPRTSPATVLVVQMRRGLRMVLRPCARRAECAPAVVPVPVLDEQYSVNARIQNVQERRGLRCPHCVAHSRRNAGASRHSAQGVQRVGSHALPPRGAEQRVRLKRVVERAQNCLNK